MMLQHEDSSVQLVDSAARSGRHAGEGTSIMGATSGPGWSVVVRHGWHVA